jgi:tRNA threonylcarbamoyladenosine dehydratase
MPAVFGLTVANHIMLSIAGYPSDYAGAKGRDKMYDSILAYVQSSEEKLQRILQGDKLLDGLKIPLTIGDVAFLMEDIFKGRSVVTGVPTKLVIIRWKKPTADSMLVIEGQKSSSLRLSELVCMTKDEATRHEKKVFKGGKSLKEVYDKETIKKVEEKLAEVEQYERFRG